MMSSHEPLGYTGIVTNNETNILTWTIRNSAQSNSLEAFPGIDSSITAFPGIVIYADDENGTPDFNWFQQTSAHEFGHAVGLGDAYNAPYRGGRQFLY